MPTIPSRDRTEIIDEIRRYAHERLSPQQLRLFGPFVAQYYGHVARGDLAARPVHDLYGAAMSHLTLAQDREPGEPLVRVYSPDFEEHGFGSPHTVVDIVSDDMPFIVDSIATEVIRHGLGLHLTVRPVIPVRRDAGRLVDILDRHDPTSGTTAESFLHLEVDRQTGAAVLDELGRDLLRILGDVQAAVEDWSAMREQALAVAATVEHGRVDLRRGGPQGGGRPAAMARRRPLHVPRLPRVRARSDDGEDDAAAPSRAPGSGILRETSRSRPVSHSFASCRPRCGGWRASRRCSSSRRRTRASTVHRPATSTTSASSASTSPRASSASAASSASTRDAAYSASAVGDPGAAPQGAARRSSARASRRAATTDKALRRDPRDATRATSCSRSTRTSCSRPRWASSHLGERRRVRLFVRRDPFGRFVSCLVFVPRDRYTTETAQRIEQILLRRRSAAEHEYDRRRCVGVGAGAPARHRPAPSPARARRTTSPRSRRRLADGDARVGRRPARRAGRAARRGARRRALHGATPTRSRRRTATTSAARGRRRHRADRAARRPTTTSTMQPLPAARGRAGHAALQALPLGPAVAALRRAAAAREHGRQGRRRAPVRDHAGRRRAGLDLRLRAAPTERSSTLRGRPDARALPGRVRPGLARRRRERRLQPAGARRRAALAARSRCCARIAKYLRQTGAHVQPSVHGGDARRQSRARARSSSSSSRLRLDPDRGHGPRAAPSTRVHDLEAGARRRREPRRGPHPARAPRASCRRRCAPTTSSAGPTATPKPYLAFKLDPAQMPDLPLPRPMFEIFVYSPRVEGVHLRGGQVARGGIRWSDRREDFRTEVLGLMKAQTVKNAVIVPVGAKGGFVVKRPPAGAATRCAPRSSPATGCSSAACSTSPTTSSAGAVVPPPRRRAPRRRRPLPRRRGRQGHRDVLRHRQRHLAGVRLLARRRVRVGRLGRLRPQGDGHHGARRVGVGAAPLPRARRRHRQTTTSRSSASATCRATCSATACCCRAHIRLVAAFDHRHVFLDPDPDPARQLRRARSGCSSCRARRWADYDRALISAGGGVFPRTAKSIPLSPEVARRARRRRRRRCTPNELIRAILRAPVDLLWNGGIGTYVKARDETQRRRRRPAPTTRVRVDAGRAALPGRRRGRQPRLHAARPRRVRARAAAASTPTRSTTRPASTAPTTRSTSRSCSTRVVADGELTGEAAQRRCSRR